MKISAVNNVYVNKNNMTRFKGLWGESKVETLSTPYYSYAQMADEGTSHTLTTSFYYPFADETKEEINEIVKKHSGKDTSYARDRDLTPPSSPWGSIDAVDYINEYKINVMPKLGFTAQQYEDYKNRDLLSKDEMFVEDCLKIAKLKKYLI